MVKTEKHVWEFDAADSPFQYVYEALAEHVGRLITSGVLPARSTLPSEREFAKLCDVSLGTARHATALLRARGFVVTVRAKGTYVADNPPGRDGSRLTLINGEPAG